MTYKDILKLKEGAHVVTVNTERCLVVRLREGYTLTTLIPGNRCSSSATANAGICFGRTGSTTYFQTTDEEEHL